MNVLKVQTLFNDLFMLKTIVSFFLVILLSSISFTATYYVNSSVGSSGDGSIGSPWKAISDITGVTVEDTVLFASGETWAETLVPVSGLIGQEVVYGSYGNGAKPSIRNFLAENKSYVYVKNIKLETTTSGYAVTIDSSNYITIINCDLYVAAGSFAYRVLIIDNNSTYNKIIDCYIQHKNVGIENDCIGIRFNSTHNLLQGNTIKDATHTGVNVQGTTDAFPSYENKYNIIRNNTIICLNSRPLSVNTVSNYTLIENNIFAGGKNAPNSSGGQTVKIVTSNNIFRNNIISDNVDGIEGALSTYVYAYGSYPPNIANNNCFYQNVIHGGGIGFGNWDYVDGCRVENNYIKNNIVYSDSQDYQINIRDHAGIDTNFYFNNLLWEAVATDIIYFEAVVGSVVSIETAYPLYFKKNIQQFPILNADYKPSKNFQGIDQGDFLTNATNSGSNDTIIEVDNSGYFTDGWGLINGDIIQLEGQLQTVRIMDINEDSNKITISDPLSWEIGVGVSLPYSGRAPDIGTYEYDASLNIAVSGNYEVKEANSIAGTTRFDVDTIDTDSVKIFNNYTPKSHLGWEDILATGSISGADSATAIVTLILNAYDKNDSLISSTIIGTFETESGGAILLPFGASTGGFGNHFDVWIKSNEEVVFKNFYHYQRRVKQISNAIR